MQPNKYINVTKKKKTKKQKNLGETLTPPSENSCRGKSHLVALSGQPVAWVVPIIPTSSLQVEPPASEVPCTPRRPPQRPASSSSLSLPTLGLTDLQGPASAQIPWDCIFFFWGGDPLSVPGSGLLRWLIALLCPSHRPYGHGGGTWSLTSEWVGAGPGRS